MNKIKNLFKELEQRHKEHPEERFWQAVRNISDYNFVLVSNNLEEEPIDTFYFE